MKTFGQRLVCTETDNEKIKKIQEALAEIGRAHV